MGSARIQEQADILFMEHPTISAAVNMLFIEKEMKNDMGGFETLIVLHGIYQEIYRVRSYHERSLASWVPSIRWASQSPPEVHHQSDLESRSAANISNWRNAALDCVDVLHWAANATIAKAAGVEHPNVFHLHFARVVLLAPYQCIQTLATSIACLRQGALSKENMVSREEAATAEREVLRWAQQDEHKARLAVLHCGCFYWHIRRYSRDAFYEPLSVYLVTLTLWAYSSYSSRVSQQDGGHVGSADHVNFIQQDSDDRDHRKSVTAMHRQALKQPGEVSDDPRCIVSVEDDDNHEPTFIRLDRPNDDEMVQLFVRKGRPSVMTAHIAGVGNICSSQGPLKILREGRKILSAVSSAWGRSREQISILEALEKAMSGRQ
ncbi:hypothetical protein TruAng_001347 [Truncatella angustata]|nr:hypothetical protein TruAng_001347 [Truncatella angustata]